MAAIGIVVGAVSFILWTTLSGMSPAIAIPFFLIVMAYGLTYARVRAEVGVAHDFVYPYRLPQYTILYAIGSRGVLNIGGPRTMVIFTMLSFLSRFHPVQIMTAYQTDSFQIAKAGRLNTRLLPLVLTIAFVCGLVFAFGATSPPSTRTASMSWSRIRSTPTGAPPTPTAHTRPWSVR